MLLCSQYQHLLKHHVAKKKVPFVDETGQQIEPTKPNAIKLEKFIFDVFQFSQYTLLSYVPSCIIHVLKYRKFFYDLFTANVTHYA